MALASALAAACPRGPCESIDINDPEVVAVLTSDGQAVSCLAGLLKARCPKLLQQVSTQGVVVAGEELAVVLALLHWVYLGRLPENLTTAGDGDTAFLARMLALSHGWGLRDASKLQERLTSSRSKAYRLVGTLSEDVLTGYRSGVLTGRFLFCCPMPSAGQMEVEEEETAVLDGGLSFILRHSSEYFQAMLCGAWAESCSAVGNEQRVVTVYWPRDQLARLLEFVHGGNFIAGPEDLKVAVDCAAYFGVPSLLHHVREWVASNLRVSTAPALWSFVDSEPLMQLQDIEGLEESEDVEAACFEYHVKHFSELAGIKEWEAFGSDQGTSSELEASCEEAPPLHSLSVALLHRLLMSGLVCLPTRQLLRVVERFARAKCSEPSSQEAFAKLFPSLLPPAVIFNRDCRSALLQSTEDVNNARAVVVM
eukprot:TRINITY_DN41868_c0_g1_i1.p1 TRINITY_DN41868_c0_g1~~TRINITY_DN41868_c0_g1_i1.p1  ORF type:complete len:439 (+),score=95.45 TRINITY_DN41868_c0_g1_i1:47-1318(+)